MPHAFRQRMATPDELALLGSAPEVAFVVQPAVTSLSGETLVGLLDWNGRPQVHALGCPDLEIEARHVRKVGKVPTFYLFLRSSRSWAETWFRETGGGAPHKVRPCR